MLTPQENERLARVGPGTIMGETFRRYWIPALLSEELSAADGPPVRVLSRLPLDTNGTCVDTPNVIPSPVEGQPPSEDLS